MPFVRVSLSNALEPVRIFPQWATRRFQRLRAISIRWLIASIDASQSDMAGRSSADSSTGAASEAVDAGRVCVAAEHLFACAQRSSASAIDAFSLLRGAASACTRRAIVTAVDAVAKKHCADARRSIVGRLPAISERWFNVACPRGGRLYECVRCIVLLIRVTALLLVQGCAVHSAQLDRTRATQQWLFGQARVRLESKRCRSVSTWSSTSTSMNHVRPSVWREHCWLSKQMSISAWKLVRSDSRHDFVYCRHLQALSGSHRPTRLDDTRRKWRQHGGERSLMFKEGTSCD